MKLMCLFYFVESNRIESAGIPVALLLMQRNATVTIAHSRTADIEGASCA